MTPPAPRPPLDDLLPLLLLLRAAALDELDDVCAVELAAVPSVLVIEGVADVSVTITVTMPVFELPPFPVAEAVMTEVTRMVEGALVLPVTVATTAAALLVVET